MERMVNSILLGLELGELQSFENVAVFPLLFSKNGGPEYVTLKEAIERGVFAVTEVSAGGSVPDLRVENKGDVGVLLLDGEELAGAKQNRILNTTIFVAPKTSIKVPVSCTEHGRWSYVSPEFRESGHMMVANLRRVNLADVNLSLEASRQFRSNQARVWNEIAVLHQDLDVRSATGAMKDAFEAKKVDLDAYLNHFPAVAGQKGLLSFINGWAAGLDFISREQAYGVLHNKLLKSYALEAILAGRRDRPERQGRRRIFGRAKKGPGQDQAAAEQKKWATPDEAAAREFLRSAAACEEKAYESVGEGWSYRYTGKDVVGSALAVDGSIVHAAFFRTAGSESESEKAGPMADFGRRRRFRII
jgi:hypothetical protein